ncbi:MAG: hypothetical protein Q8Q09_11120 [Deltaproteobacteria bacterium]|nr:hypothetical protein [Deltaproteobacteria bacterium]
MGARPPVAHALKLELACATVVNSGASAQRVDIELRVPGLAEPRMQSITVNARSQGEVCVTPAFNASIRALRAEQPGTIEVYARLPDTSEISRAMRSFTATPANGVLWGRVAPLTDMAQLASVFVTPNDPTVLSLRPAIERRSVFPGGFGGSGAYSRPAYDRTSPIARSGYTAEIFYLRRGETITWSLGSVTGGDGALDVYGFTAAQFLDWINRGGTATTSIARGQRTGARGSMVAPESGFYSLVLFSGDATAGRTVTWTRSVTPYDVVFDALSAIFYELRAQGLQYTNISSSYFDGWQRIRRPAESIAMRSANCIDGTLLFASVLESIGIRAFIVVVPGHAFVAAQMGPEATAELMPFETTMVGGPETAIDALSCGLESCIVPSPTFRHAIDVTAARVAGIRAIPSS